MDADGGFIELWARAVQSYVLATGRSEGESSTLSAIQDPADLLARVEKDNNRFSAFREKHGKLRRVLKAVLQPVMAASNIAGGVIENSPFAPSRAILGAVAFLVKSAGGVSDVYDCIEKLLSDLGSFTQRLDEYVQTDIGSHLQAILVSILACLLQILGRSECVIREGRWKRFGKLLVLGEDAKVKALFSELGQLLDAEQRHIAARSYRLCSDIVDRVEEVVDITTAARSTAKQIYDEQCMKAQKVFIDKHLKTPALEKNTAIYLEYTETTLKSSGEWLMAENALQRWLNRKSRFLFVQGLPGTGKSHLSAITVKKLNSMYPQDTVNHGSAVSVAYFYIKEYEQDLQDLGNMLKSICYQFSSDADFWAHLQDVLKQPGVTAAPRRIWANLLSSFFGRADRPNSAMIVLDGLDEAPRKMLKDLFSLIEDTARMADSVRISIAIFARPEIAEHFRPRFAEALYQVDIGDKNEGDIAAYVKGHVLQILVVRQKMQQKGKRFAVELARRIRDRVMAKVEGMFIKAVLILNQLYDKERESSLFAAIEASPPKLDDMIAHTFERLLTDDDVDKEDLCELLLWVCAAKRPLTIAELYAILKKRTGNPYDALEARLRGKFASIFKLTEQHIPVSSDSDGGDNSQTNPSATLARSSTFDFDIDQDVPDDSDDELDDGGGAIDVDNEEGRTVDDAFSETAPFNAETLWRFWNTEVKISHSSIMDFLAKEGEGWLAKIGLVVDLNAADIHVSRHLLQRLVEVSPKTGSSPDCDYLHYAASFFMDHLMAIDVDQTPDEEVQSIIQQVCKLFSHGDTLNTMIRLMETRGNKMIHYFFERPELSMALRFRWLVRAREDFFTPDEWQWIQASISTRAELFRPLAVQCARLWLSKTGQDDPDYLNERYQLYLVWIVHSFFCIKKVENDSKLLDLDIGGLTAFETPRSGVDSLRELAEFVPMERTTHWHTSFGWLLCHTRDYSAAALEYRKAISLDVNSWRAHEGLGLCLSKMGDHEEAMKLLREALSKAPETLSNAASRIRRDMIELSLSQKDFATARDLAQELFNTDKEDYALLELYIKALYGLKDFFGIVSLLKECQDSLPAGRTLHSNMFRGVDQEVGHALRSQNALSMLQPAIRTSLEPGPDALDFTTYPWLAAWIAEFMYWHYDDIDDSQRLFERILSPEFGDGILPDLKWAYAYPSHSARQHLAWIYYDKAVQAYHNPDASPEEWLVKLRELTPSDMHDTTAQRMLGTYLRRYSGADRSEWKPYFRETILSAIDGLEKSDNLPGTKRPCYLISPLLSVGDVAGAVAAAVFIHRYVSDGSPFEAAVLASGFANDKFVCDGLCSGWSFTYNDVYKALYFCLECYDMAFCEECYPLLKSGALPFRKCSMKHEHIQLFPVPEEAKGVATTFDGVSVKLSREWLGRLKEEWS